MSKVCEKHREHPVKIYDQCVGCEIESLRAEVDRLKHGGWISVKERLPEFPKGKDKIQLIVRTERGLVTAMDWARNPYAKTERGQKPKWYWRDLISPWEVTHWMPLPEPPKEGENV